MPKFVIERNISGAGTWDEEVKRNAAQKSNIVLSLLGPSIQWIESYVTGDKLYCVYIAPNAEILREHAREAGFPADRISEVVSIIDPTTAEIAR
jgi:hypothetical protein